MNVELPLTAADFARYAKVSRHVVAQWIARARERGEPIVVRDRLGPRGAPRYRLGDLLEANTQALVNNRGPGRRPRREVVNG